ncbi:hypothetical protein D3C87_1297700 [compost metagenome]
MPNPFLQLIEMFLAAADVALGSFKCLDGSGVFSRQFFMPLLLCAGHALQHRQAIFQLVDVNLAEQLTDHRHQQREQVTVGFLFVAIDAWRWGM